MAGRGPAPKERRVRDRDNKQRTVVDPTSTVKHGPPLPSAAQVLPDGESWHPQTKKWWDSLRRWQFLENEPDASWQFLIDTALMHHTMWTKGRWEFASEIRLRVAKYAVSPEDRARLKVAIQVPSPVSAAPTPTEDGPAPPTSLEERRRRILGDPKTSGT